MVILKIIQYQHRDSLIAQLVKNPPAKQETPGLDEVSLALQWLERNPQLSLATRGEDWASQGQPKDEVKDANWAETLKFGPEGVGELTYRE